MSNYQIENTPLWPIIESITTSPIEPTRKTITGLLSTVVEDIPILKITDVDVIRDYSNNIGDVVHISFEMMLGDYVTRLYPYRANMELTLKTTLLNLVTSTEVITPRVSTERFKAVFLKEVNLNPGSSDLNTYDGVSINLTGMTTVQLQLINRSLEPIRIKTVQGVYRKVTQYSVIFNILGGESLKVLIDGKPAIDAIEIYPPDNKDINNHVVLKSGTHIVSVPTYLQEHSQGVYNAGIGTYLQQINGIRIWYVYPLYNTNRFSTDINTPKILFYAVPPNRFGATEKTFNSSGGITSVIVTGSRQYTDSGESDYMNKGSGFKMAEADFFMTKPINVTAAGPVATRRKINYEVVGTERQDGLNYAPVGEVAISTNPFVGYTKSLLRKGARIDLTWENANPDLIFPGMPCRYVYLNGLVPVQVDGVILFVHAQTKLSGSGLSNHAYTTSCKITIFVVAATSLPSTIAEQSIGTF